MVLDLVVSKNLARRHLNTGQRARVALAYEAAYAQAIKADEAARKTKFPTRGNTDSTVPDPAQSLRSEKAREASSRAAKATGTSATAVKQMKALKRDAPDLAEQVRDGGMALDAAYPQARQRTLAGAAGDPCWMNPAHAQTLPSSWRSLCERSRLRWNGRGCGGPRPRRRRARAAAQSADGWRRRAGQRRLGGAPWTAQTRECPGDAATSRGAADSRLGADDMGNAIPIPVHEIWADELRSIQQTGGLAGDARSRIDALIGDILATGRSHADRYAELRADYAELQADYLKVRARSISPATPTP